MAKTVISTPTGRAIWPHLHAPDTKFDNDGVYSVKLALSPEEGAALAERLDRAMEASLAEAQKETGKKKVKQADPPYTVDEETGDYHFNFKMKASGTTRNGRRWEQSPKLFDARGRPVPEGTRVGGGSKVRVAFFIDPWFTSLLGAGISLRLKAVQIIELVEFGGGSADYFGFDAVEDEDAFDADDLPEQDEAPEVEEDEDDEFSEDDDF